jgi:hypothetical protein
MSKLIPGNQKHLTLEDRRYIENHLMKASHLKTLLSFFVKTRLLFQKKLSYTEQQIHGIRVVLITHITSVFIVLDVRRQMYAKNSSYATRSVVLASNVIKYANILKKNNVVD